MGTLVRCEFCGKRVRANGLKIHNKQCVKRRRLVKLEYNKRNTQTLEYRSERLKPFLENLDGYDLANMTDLQFNALVDNLAALSKQKSQKEIELESKRIDAEMALKADEIKAMEQAKKDMARKKEEETERIKQANLEAENVRRDLEKRQNRQNEVSDIIGKANPKSVSAEDKIKSEIGAIDKTARNILPEKKKVSAKETKKRGKPKTKKVK